STNRSNQPQTLVLGDLRVSEDRKRRYAVADQSRDRRADSTGYQQHLGFTTAFLLGHAIAEVLMQPFGESGFQRGASAVDRLLQYPFQSGRQRVDGQLGLESVEPLHDETPQCVTYRRRQYRRVLGLRTVLQQRFHDLAHLPQRYLFDQQRLQHPHHHRQRQQLGCQILDQ